MCAEMNMIWLHVEASNLKLSGWVWSPCSQERTEKSYHASSLFRLAPPHPLPPLADHLLQVYPLLRVAFSWSQGHLSSFIVFWQLGMWSWQAFLFVVGCPMVPTSKSLWVPGSKKKKTSRNSFPMSGIDCSSIFLPGHWQFLYPAASWSHLVSLHTE